MAMAAAEQLKAVFVASTSAVAHERDGATAQLMQVCAQTQATPKTVTAFFFSPQWVVGAGSSLRGWTEENLG